MYLLIDAGNTRLKYGLHDGADWLVQDASALDAAEPLRLPPAVRPHRIVVSNVAGDAVAGRIDALLKDFDAPVEWLRASPRRCGLANGYAHAEALGPDRWAAAIAGWRTSGACLVVSAGTATTIDIVMAAGHFAGGCILPGLDTMLDSLPRRTAGLPRSHGAYAIPPRNTHDAIATGCLLAQAGAIERMAEEAGRPPVLLTGGNAERILPCLRLPARHMPGLVLDGLLAIATDGNDN